MGNVGRLEVAAAHAVLHAERLSQSQCDQTQHAHGAEHQGMDISTSALQRDTRSRSTNFSVAATKNIPSLFAKLGADASYGFGDSEQAISSSEGAADIIKVRSNNYNLHGNASVTPVPWLELRCDIRYGYTESHPLSLTPTPNPSRGEGSLDTLPSEDATSNANQAPLPSGGAGGGCQGVGGGFLLGLTGMMFTDKFQTICSLKGGNSISI